jgi:DNA polymerase-3 subunit epsilon
MLGLDFESTGVDTERDRIVTAALVEVGPGGAQPHHWVIDPGVDVPESAARIHGWTTERVRAQGGDPREILGVLAGTIAALMGDGVPVVGMNLAFDFTIFDRELRRYGLPTLEDRLGGPIRPVIDVYVLDKHLSFRKGSRKLVDMAAFYGVPLAPDAAHDAVADVLASARIAYKIGRQNERVGSMSIGELHDAQVGWRAEQQASLAEYFARQGKNERCDGRWPMIPLAGAEAAR